MNKSFLNRNIIRLFCIGAAILLTTACTGGDGGGGGGSNKGGSNTPPVANAGKDQGNLLVGSTVLLNGTGSSDADGNPLSYNWSIANAPSGSNANLVNPSSQTPSITLDLAGTYMIDLTVNDGQVDSNSASVQLTAQTFTSLNDVLALNKNFNDISERHGGDGGNVTIKSVGGALDIDRNRYTTANFDLGQNPLIIDTDRTLTPGDTSTCTGCGTNQLGGSVIPGQPATGLYVSPGATLTLLNNSSSVDQAKLELLPANLTRGQNDTYTIYSLPWTFPFFGRTISAVSVNTHGLIELLEDSENCVECGNANTHLLGNHLDSMDAIFAANGYLGLESGYLYFTDKTNYVLMEWLGKVGATMYPSSLNFQVRLYPTGEIQWYFKEYTLPLYPPEIYSGIYPNGGSEIDVDTGIGNNTAFEFDPGSGQITPITFDWIDTIKETVVVYGTLQSAYKTNSENRYDLELITGKINVGPQGEVLTSSADHGGQLTLSAKTIVASGLISSSNDYTGGTGGDISLIAYSDIELLGYNTIDASGGISTQSTYLAGNGGNIDVAAAKGIYNNTQIITQGAYGRVSGGTSGSISLTNYLSGTISNHGKLESIGGSGLDFGANAFTITLTNHGGEIENTADIDNLGGYTTIIIPYLDIPYIGQCSGNASFGGSATGIEIKAAGSIDNSGLLRAQGGECVCPDCTGGQGGTVRLSTSTELSGRPAVYPTLDNSGGITVSGGDAGADSNANNATGGSAGGVYVAAEGNVTNSGILQATGGNCGSGCSTGYGGDGGIINLVSHFGHLVNFNDLIVDGGDAAHSYSGKGGDAGAIDVIAYDNDTIGAHVALDPGTGGGNSTISAEGGLVRNNTGDTGTGGNGGMINIDSSWNGNDSTVNGVDMQFGGGVGPTPGTLGSVTVDQAVPAGCEPPNSSCTVTKN